MTRQANRTRDSLLVWVVATAAGGEALLETFVSLLHRRVGDVAIWGVGAIALFLAALLVERVKARREEYA